MKLSVQWLRDYVKFPPPIEKAAEKLTLAGLEVEKVTPVEGSKDQLFEVEITSNRPDWLSHIGVARELAAVMNLTLKLPEIDTTPSRRLPQGWKISVKDLKACPFYTGVVLEGVENQKTPSYMVERLEAVGLRSINLVVDITNYVLLETGQPLHAFDADLIKGNEIIVRKARKGEKIQAIDGKEYELVSEDLVIADAERPIAIAGVMGGKETEVTEKTRNILLESAFFDPATVRRTSRRLQLSTDSSYRFERRVDPEGVEFASKRALLLLKEMTKPRFVSASMHQGTRPIDKVRPIHLSAEEVTSALGVSIKTGEVVSILKRLGLSVKPKGTAGWSVSTPSFRADLTRGIDLIEEIARIYGYDRIPETLPALVPVDFQPGPVEKLRTEIIRDLVGQGFYETNTFSLISEKGILPAFKEASLVRIVNPQNKELCWMRPTLLTSLLNVARKNYFLSRKTISLFEVSKVYSVSEGKKQPKERYVLGVLMSGLRREQNWLDSERDTSFYDLKGFILSALRKWKVAAPLFQHEEHVLLNGEVCEKIQSVKTDIGYLGEVTSKLQQEWDIEKPLYYAELDLEALIGSRNNEIVLQDPPKFPYIERDLSIQVKEDIKAGEIESEIRKAANDLLTDVQVFDLFRGGRVPKGYKNIAFRLRYQSHEKTLVSSDIQVMHEKIADTVSGRFQAAFQKGT